jgi:uncharacterized membrane protein
MNWYRLSIVLHVLAAVLWFGHMFFWSIVIGPIFKRFTPPETGHMLRQCSESYGGLGWPCLFVLLTTGTALLSYRGVTLAQVMSGEFFLSPSGRILRVKFFLVACMILYQAVIGHRRAPRLIYVNMFVALVILGLSALLTRAPGIF